MKAIYTLLILLIPFVGYGQTTNQFGKSIKKVNTNDSIAHLSKKPFDLRFDIQTRTLSSCDDILNDKIGTVTFNLSQKHFQFKLSKNKNSKPYSKKLDFFKIAITYIDNSSDTFKLNKVGENTIELKKMPYTFAYSRISKKHNLYESYINIPYLDYSYNYLIEFNKLSKPNKIVTSHLYYYKNSIIDFVFNTDNLKIPITTKPNMTFTTFDNYNSLDIVLDISSTVNLDNQILELAKCLGVDGVTRNYNSETITNSTSSYEIINSFDVLLFNASPIYGSVSNDENFINNKFNYIFYYTKNKIYSTEEKINKIDALSKLTNMLKQGLISEDEFFKLKKELLD